MRNESWQERLTKHSELKFPCEPPCDSHGVCSNCGDALPFRVGAQFGYAEGRKDERENAKALVEAIEELRTDSPEAAWFVANYLDKALAKYNATLAGGEK